MGLMGGRTALGEIFHREDLQSLLAAGHELGCHTLNHTRSCDATPTELLNSCRENRVRMAEELRGYEPRSFAFPEGVVTMAGKAALGSTYESCRTIEPGLNCDPVDLAYLRANRVYSRWGISGLKQAIRSNLERNGWMILYTHDVAENPSGYGCTPVEFREILRFAVESGADVLTVGEAAKRYAAVATRRD
jgi:peptidoglycan/xylan/chitin deacetylase (PgdA/CDA1 family)